MNNDSETAAILRLLDDHATRAVDPTEAEAVDFITKFVRSHPDALHRSQVLGHLTGSAWIVDAPRTRTLLTHHRKLDKWLQPGGHADGDPDLRAVAMREAIEETGVAGMGFVSERIYDVDRHWIPVRGEVAGHWHLDIRFMIEADPKQPFVVTDESHDLAWVALEDVARLNPEESMARLVRKTRTF
ncbi:MAG TPA: NUDIX hydrolase [Opitutaceae bacterium]|nr:NUDIX hydrolase [Opitutaceae bacterium]